MLYVANREIMVFQNGVYILEIQCIVFLTFSRFHTVPLLFERCLLQDLHSAPWPPPAASLNAVRTVR